MIIMTTKTNSWFLKWKSIHIFVKFINEMQEKSWSEWYNNKFLIAQGEIEKENCSVTKTLFGE